MTRSEVQRMVISKSDQSKMTELLNQLRQKDVAEYEHSVRIQTVVDKMLKQYDIPQFEKDYISIAAVLHDIGKLNVSVYVLRKNGRLDFDEYEEAKTHTEVAEDLIKDLACADNIRALIRHHHENVNGFGYPDGIEEEEIPLGAKMIHVAEAYDALRYPRNRVTRNAVSREKALQEIREYAGRIYDNDVVERFHKVVGEITIYPEERM